MVSYTLSRSLDVLGKYFQAKMTGTPPHEYSLNESTRTGICGDLGGTSWRHSWEIQASLRKSKSRSAENLQQTCTHPRGGQQVRHVQEAQDMQQDLVWKHGQRHPVVRPRIQRGMLLVSRTGNRGAAGSESTTGCEHRLVPVHHLWVRSCVSHAPSVGLALAPVARAPAWGL